MKATKKQLAALAKARAARKAKASSKPVRKSLDIYEKRKSLPRFKNIDRGMDKRGVFRKTALGSA